MSSKKKKGDIPPPSPKVGGKEGGKGKSSKEITFGELFVQVVRGEDLLPMDSGVSSDPFLVMKVSFNDSKTVKKWTTRSMPKTLNPHWNEGTSFQIPTKKENEAKVIVTVYDEDSFSKDYMGEFSFTIAEVGDRPSEFANKWFEVQYKKGDPKADCGRVLCQIGYTSAAQLEGPYQIVQRNADVLINILFLNDEWFSLVYALLRTTHSDKISTVLVQSALKFGFTHSLVHSFIRREIIPGMQESTLFRNDSTCTKVLRCLLKQSGLQFARVVLASLIQTVIANPEKYDLQMDEELSELPDAVAVEIRKNVFELCIKLIESVQANLHLLPHMVQTCLSQVRQSVVSVFPKSAITAVGGFFFLRFLCPAMVSPESIDLIVESPSKEARRGLTLISKLVQHMSNSTILKESNVQLKDMNEFLVEHTPKVQHILDLISNTTSELPTETGAAANPYIHIESIDRSLSQEKIETLSTDLVLFVHQLRDNTLKIKGHLQRDHLAVTSVISPHIIQSNIDFMNLISGDDETAAQMARLLSSQEEGENRHLKLEPNEKILFQSTPGLLKGNHSRCVRGIITDQNKLLIVSNFFEWTKVERYPVSALSFDAANPSNTFVLMSSKMEKSSLIFENSEDVEGFRNHLSPESSSRSSPPPSPSSLSLSLHKSYPALVSSLTRDQCLRPYDWEKLQLLGGSEFFVPGKVIKIAGKNLGGVYQLVSGSISVVRPSGDGKEVLATLMPGDVYGLMSFIDGFSAKTALAAGDNGALIYGLETTELLQEFGKDHILGGKFYTYAALSLSKNLGLLTSRAAALRKPPKASNSSRSSVKSKGDDGEGMEEVVVVPAVLCRRRDAHGNFSVHSTHAIFLSKVFGSKVEVVVDYSLVRVNGGIQFLVVQMKGKQRLQMKNEEGQVYLFKLDDPQSLIDLIQAQAAKGLKAQTQGQSKAKWGRSSSIVESEAMHETMSSTDWDFLLNDGSKIKKFKRDEPCLKEGDTQNDLYQITAGSVRIEKGGNVVAKLGEGSIFGELSFLQWYTEGTEGKASANVIADARKVEMVMLDGKSVKGLLSKNARLRSCFFVYISQLIVGRLRKTLELTFAESQ